MFSIFEVCWIQCRNRWISGREYMSRKMTRQVRPIVGLMLASAMFCAGGVAVLNLRAFVLHGHHDAGRDVGDAHRGIRGVHALSARTGRAVGVDADFGIRHVDVIGRFDQRHHFHGGEAGLTAALVVERGDTHQTVGATLHAQSPVCVRGVHLERGRLDAGFFRVGGVHDLGLVSVAFRPTQVLSLIHI